MIRLSRLTDYGIVLLTHMAMGERDAMHTAQALADASGVPLPTVSKLLGELSHAGLVVSHRGRRGGYGLTRPPEAITVAEIIRALEGPVSLTECTEVAGACTLEPICPARGPWIAINRAIQRTLERLPLSALGPPPGRPRGQRPALLATSGAPS
jgi:FeS assembly SUF system regulator